MNKKGFTLIELLAVIVILAIIALIATPIILNVIEDAKKSAAIDSTYGYIEAIEFNNAMSAVSEKYKGKNIITDETLESVNSKINVKGNKATELSQLVITDGQVTSAKMCISGYNVTYENGQATTDGKECNNKIVNEQSCEYKEGQEWTFDYTKEEQIFKVPCDAIYKLEAWGAQGGSYNTTYHGGYGGYSTGQINLKKDKTLFIYVGGSGSFGTGTVAGGYNGGGTGISTASDNKQGSGGGATHIASVSGLLSELEQYKGTYSESTGTYGSEKILIVAGGGGGSNYWYYSSSSNSYSKGGSGGGYIGGTASTTYKIPDGYFVGNASGGNQSIQGNIGVAKSTWSKVLSSSNGGFGFGAFATSNGSNGGGSGFYGGGNGLETGAGGGSGYIGNPLLTQKSMYCYNCTESSNEQTKTIKTTNVSSQPISQYAKQDNGYAKITLVSFE